MYMWVIWWVTSLTARRNCTLSSRTKKCDSAGIAPIKRMVSLTSTKTELLNRQFFFCITTEDTSSIPDLGPSKYPEAPDIIVHPNGVQKLLRNLKPYKASGPDDVSPRFLKEIADHPSWPLYSRDHWYKTGYLMNGKTDEWKEATVSPIFKKDKSKPVNYRHSCLSAAKSSSTSSIAIWWTSSRRTRSFATSNMVSGSRDHANPSCYWEYKISHQDWTTINR